MEEIHMDHFLKKADLGLSKILAKTKKTCLKKELSFLKMENLNNFKLLEKAKNIKMRKFNLMMHNNHIKS